MNIYIHVEIVARELDGKLLLALCAAERGHEVVVSCHETIRYMVKKRNLFQPGIFHAKDIAPRSAKIKRHEKLIKRGFLITSMDEEGRLISWDYEPFAFGRFSDTSLAQMSGIFCWGNHDYTELCRIYPQYRDIFYKTGSTRADLWQNTFTTFWGMPGHLPNKKYLLFSSNFGHAQNYQRFWTIIKGHRKSGYFERTPELEEEKYIRYSEEIKVIYEVIKALKFLAKAIPDIEIVVRPHPVEDPQGWRDLFGDIDNIHVIKEGPITPWVNHSLAVMHNGCTTALETVVAGKPLITFVPFEQTFENDMPNSLGIKVINKDQLLNEVKRIINGQYDQDAVIRDVKLVSEKLFVLQNELSAERMIDVWDKISNDSLNIRNNWLHIKLALAIRNFAIYLRNVILTLFQNKKRSRYSKEFSPLSNKDIQKKVLLLKQCSKRGQNVSVEMLDNRTILFRKKQ